MSTINIKDVTEGMCSEGKRITRSWYKSAGKPDRITARHVFDVLKSRCDRGYSIRWSWVMGIISRLLTTHQIKRVMIATRKKQIKCFYNRRNYRGKPDSYMARRLLNSMYNDDKIKVLEYALSRKK